MDRNIISEQIKAWVADNRAYAESFASELMKIDSRNLPPTGNEKACQLYFAEEMKKLGGEVEVYEVSKVEGLTEHPAYFAGRDYTDRFNTISKFFGECDGHSLMFSGHMDTVSFGNEADWTDSPLSGKVVDGKMYGRGTYDMKGGMAAAAMAVKCLKDLEIPIAGSVYIETVIDEEYGGAMGTLAGRVHGPNPDFAIIPEPTNLTMYPAHLGGCTFRARFSGVAGISFAGETFVNACEAAVRFVTIMKDYKAYRNTNIVVPEYWDKDWELDCSISGLQSGNVEGMIIDDNPPEATVAFWIETYPGMSYQDLVDDIMDFYYKNVDKYTNLTACEPKLEPVHSFLTGTEMRKDAFTEEFLNTVAANGKKVLGDEFEEPTGSPFACDGFIFNLYSDTPALVLGPKGGNAHGADEFMDMKSYEDLICWYAELILDWCGTKKED